MIFVKEYSWFLKVSSLEECQHQAFFPPPILCWSPTISIDRFGSIAACREGQQPTHSCH